jgi:hypothetical protein
MRCPVKDQINNRCPAEFLNASTAAKTECCRASSGRVSGALRMASIASAAAMRATVRRRRYNSAAIGRPRPSASFAVVPSRA